MTHILTYTVKTLSPVLLSSGDGDVNLVRTKDYFPGSVLLGLFAAGLIEEEGYTSPHLEEKFYRWFLQGELQFSPAYLQGTVNDQETIFLPTPFSIHTDKKKENIYELLIESASGTSALGGYTSISGSIIYREALTKQLMFHHSRSDRIMGHSQEGEIFFYEALSPGQVFKGDIRGTEADLLTFKKIFHKKRLYRAGRSKNTQYGQIEIELRNIQKNAAEKMLRDSLDNDSDLEDNELILYFASPVILCNKNGFPQVNVILLQEYLREYFGETFKITKSFCRLEEIENFVSVWKLKKPVDRAFSAGSVFFLEFEEAITENTVASLTRLSLEGLGERVNEGYGRVVIKANLPEAYELKDYQSLSGKQVLRPEEEMPAEVQSLFREIIKNTIRRETKRMAGNDASSFLPRPSNSLLGRLELFLHRHKENMDPEGSGFSGFLENIEALRSTAKDVLGKAQGRGQHRQYHLLAFLKREEDRIIQNIGERISDELKKVMGKISFSLYNDPVFHDELYYSYWLTFLQEMRGLNKRSAGQQNKNEKGDVVIG